MVIQLIEFLRKQKVKKMATEILKTTPENKVSSQNSPLGDGGKTPEQVSGSIAVLEALIAEGVDTIFGYPGGAIMPIYDALYDYQEKLQHILVRHEQGGIHA
jgi:acetolactate synthase-1/2/3 large subunit